LKDKRWITTALEKSSRPKNKLYKDWINKRTSESESKYKTYKKLFKKVSYEAEALYYKELLSSESNLIKQLWNNLNMVRSLELFLNQKKTKYPKIDSQ